MTKFIGVDGSYIFSVQLFAKNTSASAINKANIATNQNIVNNVAANFRGLTLTHMHNLVSSDRSALEILDGLAGYPSANFEMLQRLISPQSFVYIANSVVRAMANSYRHTSLVQAQGTEIEVDLNIREQDFISFTMQENIGVVLPMYVLVLQLHDKKLLKVLNPSSRFKFSFGKQESSVVNMDASIYKVKSTENGDNIVVTISGYLNATSLITTESQIAHSGTSLEVLNRILPQYGLTLATNVTQTNDAMLWKSSNSRPLDYLIKIWKHAYIDESSQLCTAIDCTGRFILTDMSKLDPNSLIIQAQNKLLFEDYPFYANFGSMRNQKYVYDITTGKVILKQLTTLNGVTSVSSSNTKLSGLRVGSYGTLTTEMHEHWYDAELLNQSRLYSSLTKVAWLSIQGNWKNYKITDIITLQSAFTDDVGKYLICGKLFCIRDRQVDMYLQLAKEKYTTLTGSDALLR